MGRTVPTREVKTVDVIIFIKHHVIYRFGVPQQIVHDNRPQFISQDFERFCNKFRIQDVPLYNPTTNGLAKAFKKTIVKLLQKFVSSSQCDWDEKLGEYLWAYHTTV